MPQTFLGKLISFILSFCLLFEQSGLAQISSTFDLSGVISGVNSVFVQDKFRPLHLRYLSYNPAEDSFGLLLDKGGREPEGRVVKDAVRKLMNYFLVGVSLPDEVFWVNLRPDGEDNVIDPLLAKTDVGRIFLETDVQLKKDTARLTSPGTSEGREYWKRLYAKAAELYGTVPAQVPSLVRPWIVPNEIIIRESFDNAYIYKATLKVMLEDDYIKRVHGRQSMVHYSGRAKALNEYAAKLMRELIIPKLSLEVNNSRRYASFRQVYYSLILARWFKSKFNARSGRYAKLINSADLSGLVSEEKWSQTVYFNEYKKSFSDGEYNIKERLDTLSGSALRSYVSGGLGMTGAQFVPATTTLGVAGDIADEIRNDPRLEAVRVGPEVVDRRRVVNAEAKINEYPVSSGSNLILSDLRRVFASEGVTTSEEELTELARRIHAAQLAAGGRGDINIDFSGIQIKGLTTGQIRPGIQAQMKLMGLSGLPVSGADNRDKSGAYFREMAGLLDKVIAEDNIRRYRSLLDSIEANELIPYSEKMVFLAKRLGSVKGKNSEFLSSHLRSLSRIIPDTIPDEAIAPIFDLIDVLELETDTSAVAHRVFELLASVSRLRPDKAEKRMLTIALEGRFDLVVWANRLVVSLSEQRPDLFDKAAMDKLTSIKALWSLNAVRNLVFSRPDLIDRSVVRCLRIFRLQYLRFYGQSFDRTPEEYLDLAEEALLEVEAKYPYLFITGIDHRNEFEEYLRINKLADFKHLRGLFNDEMRRLLLDGLAYKPVFMLVLPADKVGELKIFDEQEVMDIGGADLLNSHTVFLIGDPSVADRILSEDRSAQVIVGVTDRNTSREKDKAGDIYDDVASGRQVFFPLGDGTFLSVKGSGWVLNERKNPPYSLSVVDGRLTHYGLADEVEAECAINVCSRLDVAAGRFVRFLGYRGINFIPDGKGGFDEFSKIKGAEDLHPVLIFNRYLCPHRVSKLPQLLHSDPGLVRLLGDVSKALIKMGFLPEGKRLNIREWMFMLPRIMGYQEAVKLNNGLFKNTIHYQDFTLAGEETDNEEFVELDDYCDFLSKSGESDEYIQAVRELKMDVNGLLSKVSALWFIHEELRNDPVFYRNKAGLADPLDMMEVFFKEYFRNMDNRYLEVWAGFSSAEIGAKRTFLNIFKEKHFDILGRFMPGSSDFVPILMKLIELAKDERSRRNKEADTIRRQAVLSDLKQVFEKAGLNASDEQLTELARRIHAAQLAAGGRGDINIDFSGIQIKGLTTGEIKPGIQAQMKLMGFSGLPVDESPKNGSFGKSTFDYTYEDRHKEIDDYVVHEIFPEINSDAPVIMDWGIGGKSISGAAAPSSFEFYAAAERYFAGKKLTFIGGDNNINNVRSADRRNSEQGGKASFKFVDFDFRDKRFDGTADMVRCFATMHYYDQEERAKARAYFTQILRAGGFFIEGGESVFQVYRKHADGGLIPFKLGIVKSRLRARNGNISDLVPGVKIGAWWVHDVRDKILGAEPLEDLRYSFKEHGDVIVFDLDEKGYVKLREAASGISPADEELARSMFGYFGGVPLLNWESTDGHRIADGVMIDDFDMAQSPGGEVVRNSGAIRYNKGVPELGVGVWSKVSIGHFTIMELNSIKEAELYSNHYWNCQGVCVLAKKNGGMVLGQAYILSSATAHKQYKWLISYLSDPGNGFSDVQIMLDFADSFIGFPDNITIDDLEAEAREAGLKVRASLLRAKPECKQADIIVTPSYVLFRHEYSTGRVIYEKRLWEDDGDWKEQALDSGNSVAAAAGIIEELSSTSPLAEFVTYHNRFHLNELLEVAQKAVPLLAARHLLNDPRRASELLRTAIYLHDAGYYIPVEGVSLNNGFSKNGHEERSKAFVRDNQKRLGLSGKELEAVEFMIEFTKFETGEKFALKAELIDRCLDELREGKSLSKEVQDFVSLYMPALDTDDRNDKEFLNDVLFCVKLIAIADVYGHSSYYFLLIPGLWQEFSLEGLALPTVLEQIAGSAYFIREIAAKNRLAYLLDGRYGLASLLPELFSDSGKFKLAQEKNLSLMGAVSYLVERIKDGTLGQDGRVKFEAYIDSLSPEVVSVAMKERMKSEIGIIAANSARDTGNADNDSSISSEDEYVGLTPAQVFHRRMEKPVEKGSGWMRVVTPREAVDFHRGWSGKRDGRYTAVIGGRKYDFPAFVWDKMRAWSEKSRDLERAGYFIARPEEGGMYIVVDFLPRGSLVLDPSILQMDTGDNNELAQLTYQDFKFFGSDEIRAEFGVDENIQNELSFDRVSGGGAEFGSNLVMLPFHSHFVGSAYPRSPSPLDMKNAKGASIVYCQDSKTAFIYDKGSYAEIAEYIGDDGAGEDSNTGSQNNSELPEQDKAVPSGKEGGIDMRAMSITVQPLQGVNPGFLGADGAACDVNLDPELRQIKEMVDSGIIPSVERIRGYFSSCGRNRPGAKEFNKVILCIAGIFRIEEEMNMSSEPEFKDILFSIEKRIIQ